MLDVLLKSKFYCKCKSEIKLTIKRIEIIKRKRNAMHKFLRNDVADLLKTGLDSTAYGRVEQLYADQILSSCYEFVEQSCLQILNHLSSMNKQRECPGECKDAIPTLMYSAARFADLPELRELRSLFAERYGNHLELYVNQEFVKNLKADPPTKDLKLQMMQEIATDCGLNWNSKTLEQNLYEPPPVVQDWYQHVTDKTHESPKTHHQNGLRTNIQETEKKTEVAKKDHTFKTGLPYKPRVETDDKKEEKHKNPPVGNGLPYKSRAEIETKNQEKHDLDRTSPYWSSNTSSSSETITSPEYSTGPDDSASDDLPEEKKFNTFKSTGQPESTKKSTFSVTASSSGREDGNLESKLPEEKKLHAFKSTGQPYLKPESTKKSTFSVTASSSVREDDNLESELPEEKKLRAFKSTGQPYVKPESTKKSTFSSTASSSVREDDNLESELPEEKKLHAFKSNGQPYLKPESTKKSTFPATASSSGREDDNLKSELPEGRKYYGLRSMGPPYIKTDLVKKSTHPDEAKTSENINKLVPRSMRNRRPFKPSPKFSNDENLDHHEDYEEKKMDKLLSHYSKKPSQLPVPAPTRTGSLPADPLNTRAGPELSRAATYQPDSDLNSQSHVHPKLPDYDDFVARLAAFRASNS